MKARTTNRIIFISLLICLLCFLSLWFIGCKRSPDEYNKKTEKKTTDYTPLVSKEAREETEEEKLTLVKQGDKVTVKDQTPTGEKVFEGTVVIWYENGIKIRDGSTVLIITSPYLTVEKTLTR